MKRTIQFLFFALLIVVTTIELKGQSVKNDLTTICFKTNMDCVDCEPTLTNYLKFEKGVKDIKVEFKSNTIKVVYKTGKNNTENLAKGIRKQGYEATVITEEQYKSIVEKAMKK